jgi:hypothetical protein
MALDPKSGPFLFYHVQNDRGETGSAPNACKLSPATAGKITLRDVRAACPLTQTSAALHFRFQIIQDKQPMFLDLTNANDIVPTVNGNVVAKILRLDNLRCTGSLAPSLTLKSYVKSQAPLGSASSSSSSSSSSGPAAAGSGARNGSGGGNPSTPRVGGAGAASSTTSTSSSSAAPPPLPAAFAMPEMKSGTSLHVVPKEEDGDTHIKDDGNGVDIYKNLKAVDARGMRPVKSVSVDETPVVVPDNVDEDLADKSDYVKAKIMARRNELKKAQEERLAEVQAQQQAEVAESAALESAKAAHEAKIKEWALEPGGKVKNIRVLLSTLEQVLWEGAKWEPVPLAKLIAPPRVKASFLRACTQVHPDKQMHLEPAQRYIASQIFHYIETSYRDFQDTET